MQTDPIADFLTRIRNAAAAKHQRVDVPVVEAEDRDRPHPEGRGLHLDLQDGGRKQDAQDAARFPEVHAGPPQRHHRHEAHFASRRAPLSRRNGNPPGRRRAGHQHPDHAERLDERPFRAQGQSRRRNSLRSLVVEFGKSPVHEFRKDLRIENRCHVSDANQFQCPPA